MQEEIIQQNPNITIDDVDTYKQLKTLQNIYSAEERVREALQKAEEDRIERDQRRRSSHGKVSGMLITDTRELRRELVTLLIELEPLIKEKQEDIGFDYWDGVVIGERGGLWPLGYSSEYFITDPGVEKRIQESGCINEYGQMLGLSCLVDFPHDLSCVSKADISKVKKDKSFEPRIREAFFHIDTMVRAHRYIKEFMHLSGLGLTISTVQDSRLPIPDDVIKRMEALTT